MSTLKSVNVVHPSSAVNNIVNDASGNVTVGNNLTVTGTSTVSGTLAMGSSFKRNRIINGNMLIDQRNAGASVTQTTSILYTVDRWASYGSVASKFTIQQNAGSVTPPAGYTKYLGATSSSAYTVGASVAGVSAANGVAGQASNIVYNGVTYSAAGGALGTLAAVGGNAGGAGGSFSGVINGTTIHAWGYTGNPGHSGGAMAATTTITGIGGNTPLGLGQGGTMPTAAAGAAGNSGTGYGAGGGGARNGTGAATSRAGGASAAGLVMIEY